MKLNDIPSDHHYAVISTSTSYVHHEGDERSRTNPGHGYPAYTETITSLNYEIFKTKSELEAWLVRHTNDLSKYKVLSVSPLDVKVTMSAITKPATRSMET
jgi:hypothetical protein